MPIWLYSDGHLDWLWFAASVYTGVAVLVTDYVWRRVTLSIRTVLALAAGVWGLGLGLMGMILIG